MWIYDLETLRLLEVNEAAVKHYGYSRAEFVRMRLSDIHLKEDITRLKSMRTRSGNASNIQENGGISRKTARSSM